MGNRNMLRMIGVGILALALPLAALAEVTAESVKGNARADKEPLVAGQKLEPQVAITTEAGAQVFLRFSDGMQIVLNENSLLRIIDFRHTSSGVTDRAVFELLRGAARVVTGTVARDNPKQFFFRTPHTQLAVERPSDFTVALVNPAYIAVHKGALVSSNAAGPTTLTEGSTSIVANASTPSASIPSSSMPPQASNAMGNLSTAQVNPPAGGPAGGSPGAALAGGADLAVPALAIGAGAAAAAALLGNDDPSPTPSHH